jgi:hypothetical protein
LKGDHPRTIPAKFALIWFRGFRGKDLNVIAYQNLSFFAVLHIKMNSNFNCSYMTMSSLTYILGFSVIFFQPVYLSDTILKGTHPRTIPARVGLIWFRGFRGKDLNVIFYQNMPNLHNRYIPFKIMSNSPDLHSRWLLLLKMEISSIVHCCFSVKQNELNF